MKTRDNYTMRVFMDQAISESMREGKPIDAEALRERADELADANECLGLYNTDTCLWVNYRKAYPASVLHVQDGHIVNYGSQEVLARFENSKAAHNCLVSAGWRNHGATNQGYKFTS